MTVTDTELLTRLRDYSLEHDVRIVTRDVTARPYENNTLKVDETRDPSDIYTVNTVYGGQSVVLNSGSLYNIIWDLDLLAKNEVFEAGVIDTGYGRDPIFRSTSLTPQWNRKQ